MKLPTKESRLMLKPGYRLSRMRLCPGRASELHLAEDREITFCRWRLLSWNKTRSRELGTKEFPASSHPDSSSGKN